MRCWISQIMKKWDFLTGTEAKKSSGVDIVHDSLLFVHQFTLPKYSQSSDVIVTVPVPLTRKERDLVNIYNHYIYNICIM